MPPHNMTEPMTAERLLTILGQHDRPAMTAVLEQVTATLEDGDTAATLWQQWEAFLAAVTRQSTAH